MTARCQISKSISTLIPSVQVKLPICSSYDPMKKSEAFDFTVYLTKQRYNKKNIV